MTDRITDVNVDYEETISKDDLMKVAAEIFTKVKKSRIPVDDFKRLDEQSNKLYTEYNKFAKAYPIVFKYMTQLKKFHPKAFSRYVDMVVARPARSKDDFLEAQSNYVYMLHKALNPRCDEKAAKQLKNNIYKQLKAEDKKFGDDVKKYEAIVEKEEEARLNAKKEELIKILKERKAALEALKSVDQDIEVPSDTE